jgi:spermidine synthase
VTPPGQQDAQSQSLNSVDSGSFPLSRLAPQLTATRIGERILPALGARSVLFLSFTVSGFVGLIYESIWSHYLKLFLGHASYAQTLVLVIFMGGMAIGSLLVSRYCSRWRNLLLVYAIAECTIGVFGLLFHQLFDWGTNLAYSVVFPALDSPIAIQAVKWSIAALLIISQSILLGMTFPLISGAIIRRFPNALGYSISTLYFTNSLGAAVGVLVSGFMLISWVGLPGTIMTAGLLSVLLAAVVWLLSRHPQWREGQSAAELPHPSGGPRLRLAGPLLMVALVTGAASFMYEIAWIRMLSHVLGSSTHAFELILSAFIFGIACGSFWVRRRIDSWRDPVVKLGVIQITMGLLALATILTYSQSFEVMSFAFRTLKETAEGYGVFNIVSHIIAFGVMLPATFCAGMTLPLVTHALIGTGYGEKSIGAVFAANTLGAIIGIIVAVHLAMPALGLKGLMIIGAGLDIGLGLYILLRIVSVPATGRVISAGMVAASTLLAVHLFVQLNPKSTASAVYQHGSSSVLPGTEFPFHRDGKTATVDMLSYPIGVMAITTNGKTDATINMVDGAPVTSDEITMVLLGAIPLAARPNASSAAVIGFGSGLTTHVLLGSSLIKSVDTIEIEPAMVEASEWFRPRVERAYADSRSRIYIEDARTFFATRKGRYDIIISEPSHPWVSGISSLYSQEFYSFVKRHLSDSGVFAQWLHLTRNDPVLVASVIGALSRQFPRFAIYNTNGRDILILAGIDGDLRLDFRKIYQVPALALELDRIGVKHVQDITARRLGNAQSMSSYYGSISTSWNSDYFPVLDLNAFRAQYLGRTATELFSLRTSPLPVIEMLDSLAPRRDITEVSPGSPVERLQSIHAATLLRDYLAGSIEGDTMTLSDDIRDAVFLTEMLFRNCSAEQNSELAITHLNGIANLLMSYLQPDELAEIWQRFENASCMEHWSTRLRRWFALVKAVSARDAVVMAAISTQLLDSGDDAFNPARQEYLLATSMLGQLSVGDKRSAMASWLNHGSPAMATGELSAVLRLLVAYSRS